LLTVVWRGAEVEEGFERGIAERVRLRAVVVV
jgi:hypothetical protein